MDQLTRKPGFRLSRTVCLILLLQFALVQSSCSNQPPQTTGEGESDLTTEADQSNDADSVAQDSDGAILGDGESEASPDPTRIDDWQRVVAGNLHSCGLREDGTVLCWGGLEAPEGRFSTLSTVNQLTCGLRLTDDTAFCWGHEEVSTRVPEGSFSDVIAGGDFACGLQPDGVLHCWCDPNSPSFTPCGTADSVRYVQVDGGFQHLCGVTDEGTAHCWGGSRNGQTDAPTGEFRQVSSGNRHSCGIREDGEAACWGDWQLGTLTPPEGPFESISAGAGHACALRPDGQISCWGHNSAGQANSPEGRFRQVASGSNHSCGLQDDGTISCWGCGRFNWGQCDAP